MPAFRCPVAARTGGTIRLRVRASSVTASAAPPLLVVTCRRRHLVRRHQQRPARAPAGPCRRHGCALHPRARSAAELAAHRIAPALRARSGGSQLPRRRAAFCRQGRGLTARPGVAARRWSIVRRPLRRRAMPSPAVPAPRSPLPPALGATCSGRGGQLSAARGDPYRTPRRAYPALDGRRTVLPASCSRADRGSCARCWPSCAARLAAPTCAGAAPRCWSGWRLSQFRPRTGSAARSAAVPRAGHAVAQCAHRFASALATRFRPWKARMVRSARSQRNPVRERSSAHYPPPPTARCACWWWAAAGRGGVRAVVRPRCSY